MFNQPEVLGGAALQRLAKGVGLAVGAAVLTASLAVSGTPALAQATYSSTDVPQILPEAVGGGTAYTFDIEVTDEFDVADLTLSINMFVTSASIADIFLVAPDGTEITLTSYACAGGPLSWGSRAYEPPSETELDSSQTSPDPDTDGGTADTYTFADSGIKVGQRNDAGAACNTYWSQTGASSDWPTTGTQAGDFGVTGAWAKLPTSIIYRPQVGSFSDFKGKPAKGTWSLRIEKWRLNSLPFTFFDFKINSISLQFDGGTGFSGKKAARAMVQNFMASRASRLLSDDLELKDMLKKKPKPTGNVLQGLNVANNQVTSARTSMFGLGLNGGNTNQIGIFSVWAKSSYQRSENPSGDVDGYIGHVALGYQPSGNTALGILVTLDRVQQKGEEISGAIGAKVEGTGWLVGPYVVAKLDKRLTFTGRAQMGASDNTYEFSYGSWNYAGAFATKRVLVKAELAGETEVGRWLLEPSIKFGYTQDESKGAVAIWSRAYGYDDIGQVDVSEGRVELAQKVSYPINTGRFTFVPSLKVSGIWMFDSPDYVESISTDGETIVTSDEKLAAKVEAALKLTDEDSGAYAGLSIFYEGATSDNDAFGISLRGKIPLNK